MQPGSIRGLVGPTAAIIALSVSGVNPGGNHLSGKGHPYPLAISAPTLDFDTMVVGATTWDFAYPRTSGRQIAIDTSGRVHMAWTHLPTLDGTGSKYIRYNLYDDGVLASGDTGCYVGDAFGPHWDYDLDMGVDTTVPVIAKGDGESPWAFTQQPGPCSWSSYFFPSFVKGKRPRFAVQRTVDRSFYHMVTVANTGWLHYWRTPLDGLTQRPIEPPEITNHLVVTSPVSHRVAIVFVKSGGVYYYESNDTGLTWGGGPGFGVRHSLDITGAGETLTALYDYNDNLHIIYETPGPGVAGVTLQHWSQSTGTSTVVQATWNYPGIDADAFGGIGLGYYRNINFPQLGVGRGDRLNNLYLVWSQFGTAQSGDDTAANGHMNADVYMSISASGGVTWDPPRNLTGSPSPDCAGNCYGEVGVWVAEVVDSLTHILYVRDLEAGPFTNFPEPTRTNNPVYYMRLKTPDPVQAPIMTGLPGAIGPVYIRPDQADTIATSIGNSGSATLTYTLTDTMSWLRFASDPDSQSGTVPPGGPGDSVFLIIDAAGLAEGTYRGTIFVATNDPTSNGARVTVELIVTPLVVATFRHGTFGGSGCWGWRAPDGTEYALMGVSTGVAIVNASILQEITVVPGPGPCGPSWREIKTYRNYAYAVSECTGLNQGMMIVDLRYLPDSAHLVGAYTAGGIKSHNITIDTARGFAYLVKEDYRGFRVVSLANPIAPVEYPSVFISPVNSCHDMYARNDTVWVAEGNLHSFSIWNMANKNSPQMIARVTPPGGGFAHNVWPSDDGRFMYTTEEVPAGKTVKVWDTQDLGNVQLSGQYLGPNQLAHNAYAIGHFMVIAHYEAGVRIVDVTTPSAPEEIAAFDTYPQGDDPDYRGCWGAYPYTRSGRVYASNMDGTLFILEFPVLNRCDCPCAGDPQCDGVRADVLDVVAAVNVAFRGIPGTADAGCPNERSDVDCSGATDVLDAVACVDVAFRGADPNARFCDPCG